MKRFHDTKEAEAPMNSNQKQGEETGSINGSMKSERNIKIGIIGGGLMGLVLAYRLSELNALVKVIERESQPGGLSTYHNFGHFIWDKFYHVIVPTDGSLIRLINEIGLGAKLNWSRAYTGYYVKNKFYSLNSPMEYLQFPLLNLWDKLRLAYTIFYGSRINNWKKLEKITVKEWLIQMGGKKNFNKFWAPLLQSKLGENYKRVSGVFIWTYIKRLFKAREYPVKKDYMGYVSGGYKTVFDKLEQRLSENNSSIVLDTVVDRIEAAESGGVDVHFEGKVEHFDKVVFTAPLNILEQVTSPQLCEVENNDQAIEYLGVVCLVLITSRPLTPFYVLNMGDDNTPFTGVIGISTLVDQEYTAGHFITYFPKYIPADHSYWPKSDKEIEEIYMAGVRKLYPDLKDTEVISMHINRAFKVQPIQVLNYSAIIPKVSTKNKDFYVLNTSQFVNDSVNNNSVVTHVNSFVDEFKYEFQSKKTM